ncbi:hypothetical protein NDU88_006542 [Pleurodeles waltl]|uniref:Secreted protein n=1 Tax=Pleurodeles waltl TaxID=8319 RepID=A0AAV7SPY4_PLEWA|nr:hypothetical protein NDU88_006542 [Pleurodeles waltl]
MRSPQRDRDACHRLLVLPLLSPPLQCTRGPVCQVHGGPGRQDRGGCFIRGREQSFSTAGRPSCRPHPPLPDVEEI